MVGFVFILNVFLIIRSLKFKTKKEGKKDSLFMVIMTLCFEKNVF